MHDGRDHRLAMRQPPHNGHEVLDGGVLPCNHAQLRAGCQPPHARLIARQLLPHAPAPSSMA